MHMSEFEIQQHACPTSKSYFSAEIMMETQEHALLPKPKVSPANSSKPLRTS